jgi:hypothetical protein
MSSCSNFLAAGKATALVEINQWSGYQTSRKYKSVPAEYGQVLEESEKSSSLEKLI